MRTICTAILGLHLSRGCPGGGGWVPFPYPLAHGQLVLPSVLSRVHCNHHPTRPNPQSAVAQWHLPTSSSTVPLSDIHRAFCVLEVRSATPNFPRQGYAPFVKKPCLAAVVGREENCFVRGGGGGGGGTETLFSQPPLLGRRDRRGVGGGGFRVGVPDLRAIMVH